MSIAHCVETHLKERIKKEGLNLESYKDVSNLLATWLAYSKDGMKIFARDRHKKMRGIFLPIIKDNRHSFSVQGWHLIKIRLAGFLGGHLELAASREIQERAKNGR